MTQITAIPNHIIKEAEMLRNRLSKGSINFLELSQFLEKVGQHASPKPGKKAKKKEDLFKAAMSRLDKKR